MKYVGFVFSKEYHITVEALTVSVLTVIFTKWKWSDESLMCYLQYLFRERGERGAQL